MSESRILPHTWWNTHAPVEMQGATVTLAYEKLGAGSLIAIIGYIGSSVFYITPGTTRQYDLDSQMKVGAYISAIVRKLKESRKIESTHFTYSVGCAGAFKNLYEYCADTRKSIGSNGDTRCSYPPIWANAAWGSTTVLNPGEDMAKQMKSNDADLLMSALSASGTASGPASDPPEPAQRVNEGSPTSNDVAPHRRSVIRNLRDPKTYIASLLK